MIFKLSLNLDTLEATSDGNNISVNSVSEVDGILHIEVSMEEPDLSTQVMQVIN